MNTISSLLYFIGERIRSYDTKPEAYPIGSYYWTSDGNFDPNTSFGGTWEKLDEGIVLTSAGTNYPISSGTAKDGGEARHTLTVNEMPSHAHQMGAALVNASGGGTPLTIKNGTGTAFGLGYTDFACLGSGGSQSHNIMQPYKNAYCWHRTA